MTTKDYMELLESYETKCIEYDDLALRLNHIRSENDRMQKLNAKLRLNENYLIAEIRELQGRTAAAGPTEKYKAPSQV